MRGSEVLHRDVAWNPVGRRRIVVWGYRIPGSRPHWLRSWVAQGVNDRA
jgi:hypothetical protein